MRRPEHLEEGAKVAAHLLEGTVHGEVTFVSASGGIEIKLERGHIITNVHDYDLQYPAF